MSEENFFRRWSRLKATGETTPKDQAQASQSGLRAPTKPPLPTLADAASLTIDSDFSKFVAHGVSSDVRRLALKKLFSNPHFNVMDGLDIYIADFNKPDPLSETMLASLRQAQGFLLSANPPETPDDSQTSELGSTSVLPKDTSETSIDFTEAAPDDETPRPRRLPKGTM